MEEGRPFVTLLTAALEKRGAWLRVSCLPRLKGLLDTYQALMEGVLSLLVRKGMLREDPYNYEQPGGKISLPEDTALPEFENSDALSFRMTTLRRSLRLLVGGQVFELVTLGLGNLKQISSAVFYINWLEFGENSSSPTTRAFARAFMKVRVSNDILSSQILLDSQRQLVKIIPEIRGLIGDLVAYQREAWKNDIRTKVLPLLEPGIGRERSTRDEAFRYIRQRLPQAMPGASWYPALAGEVLSEDYDPDGPARREQILAALVVPQPRLDAPAQDPHAMVLEAVRGLCKHHHELSAAAATLEENEHLVAGERQSFLRRLLGLPPKRASSKSHVYEVEYTEKSRTAPHKEEVNLPELLATARKKAALFASMASAEGAAYKKLTSQTTEQVAKFLDQQVNEVIVLHRRLTGINTLFQTRATQAGKTVRGIKIELLALKNAIVKANRSRHEFRQDTEKKKTPTTEPSARVGTVSSGSSGAS